MAARSHPVSVVTGGAGFLGSHLVDRLLAEGHRVIAVDNLITGNLANIAHLSGNENFRFIKHNVSSFIMLKEDEIDYVFHFASPASPIDYLELPIPTLKVGALGTHNALGLAKAKHASFILASTSECYGDPLEHPQSEDYWGNVNPIGPRGVYDEAKRFAEALTMAYHRAHGFETRSFCFVSDLVEGIVRLLRSDYRSPVNLGNPIEVSIREFADRIKALTASRSEIAFRPLPVDDPKVRQPDITRARQLLG